MNKITLGALLVIIAALLWSFDGTFLRPHLAALPSTLVVFLEHLLGFIALLPFLIIYRSQLKTITKKQWLTIFWVALFGGALGTVFFTKALFLTGFVDVSVVILLQKFQPIFAIVLAVIFLGERFPKKFYYYAALALIGGYFVTFKNPSAIHLAGNTPLLIAAFSLLAAFAWGSSTSFGKYSLKNINYGLLAALRFGLTVLILAFPALYFYHGQINQIGARPWVTLIIIVFTSGAVAMYLYYYGLKKIPASLATLCELSWPVSAVIFDYFLNHNILSWTQIAGGLILIVCVWRITALHRPRTIVGEVIKGSHQGQQIGFRTANLDTKLAGDLPMGIYSGSVKIAKEEKRGLLYYGINSLQQIDCLEVYIFDFNADIYGQTITITTDRFLRLPKKFANATALAAQIQRDLDRAKNGL